MNVDTEQEVEGERKMVGVKTEGRTKMGRGGDRVGRNEGKGEGRKGRKRKMKRTRKRQKKKNMS